MIESHDTKVLSRAKNSTIKNSTIKNRLSSQEEAEDIISRLFGRQKYDPHSLLAIHQNRSGTHVIRLFRPGAEHLFLELYGYIVEMTRVHDYGLFEIAVSPDITLHDYRVFSSSGLLAHDPYAFWPTFSDVDQYLFSKGVDYELHRKMGARKRYHQGVEGVSFTVWAPSARSVSLICDCNFWDSRTNPMRSLGSSGVWEIFFPGMPEGVCYKFEIETGDGKRITKTDPYALEYELRPKSAAKVSDVVQYSWQDQKWMESRKSNGGNLSKPIAIYEVHLGSFIKKQGVEFLSYRELAHELVRYCLEMHFTHVELLPITEHPFDQSWGYQVTGYFAPTSRFGTPSDFQYFVDYLHRHDIGVILDWVPGHFPNDDFALYRFDGTALYEHEDPRQGFHPHWNTSIFNFGRHEVVNFLISSALFWLDSMHIDGLRVDAVASMLYLDYGRDHGQWIPNAFGGKENVDAINFLKHVNSIVHDRFPGVLMIAEESTAFPGVTTPVSYNGLGFDLKWNMGWMNDTLTYFQKDPLFRSHHHNGLTFGLLYAFTEKFQLVLSHDEVVHGKKSLLSKMPGDIWQKFANLRLLYSYMICQPGKKLWFMGGEIGSWNEWSSDHPVEWFLTCYPYHSGMQKCVQELNRLYIESAALWADDFSFHGFEWVDFSDNQNSVISYIRKKPNSSEAFYIIHNFTPTYFPHYWINIRHIRSMKEVFNSDDSRYGGSGKVLGHLEIVSDPWNSGATTGAVVAIPPLATVIYSVEWA